MRVSEIRVNQIRVNQGLGVFKMPQLNTSYTKASTSRLTFFVNAYIMTGQEVPTFRDFWFQSAIMKCGDHEFRGLFLV